MEDFLVDGSRIRLFREAMGLSQDDLAARMLPKPISRQLVTTWENGKGIRTFRIVKRLANAMGIRTSLLAWALLTAHDEEDDLIASMRLEGLLGLPPQPPKKVYPKKKKIPKGRKKYEGLKEELEKLALEKLASDSPNK